MQRRRLHHPPNRREKSMRLNGLALIVLSTIILIIIAPLTTYDNVYCVVSNAGESSVNGYYVGLGGIYYKRGYSRYFVPDYFELLSIRQYLSNSFVISLADGHWSIRKNNQIPMYISTTTTNIDNPKQSSSYPWEVTKDSKSPAPTIDYCYGSLQDSHDIPDYAHDSNIQILYHRPINTLIIVIILIIFGLIQFNRLDRSLLVISYDFVINKDEFYRIVTASLSHFDWLHIMFNILSLYQLGEIELYIGSGAYFYLNLDLIFITMIILLGIQYILIHKFNHTNHINQQSLGFSCVLFAWMVFISVKLQKFCPIFLFPSLCFKTFQIPSIGLPVNLGPFALLLFTKLILPQSSFLGHFSGIVIGYPLAWKLLNWFTPSLLLCVCISLIIYKLKLYIWKLSIYSTVRTMESFDEIIPSIHYQWIRILMICLLTYIPMSLLMIIFMGWKQVPVRFIGVYLLYNSYYAIQCSWLTDHNQSLKTCFDCIIITFIYILCLWFLDVLSLGGLLTSSSYTLLTTVSWITNYLPYQLIVSFIIILLILQGIIMISLWYGLKELRLAAVWLEFLRLDPMSIDIDMNLLGVNYVIYCCKKVVSVINTLINTTRGGTGHRLGFMRLSSMDESQSNHNHNLLGSQAIHSDAEMSEMGVNENIVNNTTVKSSKAVVML